MNQSLILTCKLAVLTCAFHCELSTVENICTTLKQLRKLTVRRLNVGQSWTKVRQFNLTLTLVDTKSTLQSLTPDFWPIRIFYQLS